MKDINKKDVKVVAFDAFDTLFRYNSSGKYGVYRDLLEILVSENTNGQEQNIKKHFAQLALTEDIQLKFLLKNIQEKYHIKPPQEKIIEIQKNITHELASIQTYLDALPTIKQLKHIGLKTAVISNLAKPYGEAIKKQLKGIDTLIFSYKVGACKPNRQIFQELASQQKIEMKNILMIGNNFKNDYAAAKLHGAQALRLDRDDGDYTIDDKCKIESLEELPDILI